MNSICSNCKKKTTFILDQDTIQINCQCGNNSSMSIIDFLNEYKSQNHMINEIKIAYDHLLNYFTTLKNDTINQLHEPNPPMQIVSIAINRNYSIFYKQSLIKTPQTIRITLCFFISAKSIILLTT